MVLQAADPPAFGHIPHLASHIGSGTMPPAGMFPGSTAASCTSPRLCNTEVIDQ